jgi:hypothetical protein
MKDNFDLKKYLIENKATNQSRLSENEVTKKQLIDKFKTWIGKDNTPTSVDIDYYSNKNNLTQDEKSLLKKIFLNDIEIKIKKTGPVPNIRFKTK